MTGSDGKDHRGDGELHAESLSVAVKRTVISLLLVRREVGKFLNPMKSAAAQRKRVEVETTQRHRDVVPVDLPRQIQPVAGWPIDGQRRVVQGDGMRVDRSTPSDDHVVHRLDAKSVGFVDDEALPAGSL